MTAALPTIAQAISGVMSEVGAIGKNKKTEGYASFMYRGIDDAYNALQPALVKHGVFFVPKLLKKEQHDRVSNKGGTNICTSVEVQYTFYGPAGDHIEAVVPGEAMDSGDKGTNKAMSAALKYLLMQVFCIPTEEQAKEEADAKTEEAGSKTEVPKTGGQNTGSQSPKPPPPSSSGSEKAKPADRVEAAIAAGKPSFVEYTGKDDAKLSQEEREAFFAGMKEYGWLAQQTNEFVKTNFNISIPSITQSIAFKMINYALENPKS